jgi:hypothetical protein
MTLAPTMRRRRTSTITKHPVLIFVKALVEVTGLGDLTNYHQPTDVPWVAFG